MKEIIELFGKAVIEPAQIDFVTVNKIAVKVGYFIPKSLCNETVVNWLGEKNINYNATFYKSWNDIISKNRFELYLDQITHYLSTYGTNYTGETYIPNTGSDIIPFSEMKVLESISSSEVISRCTAMLTSGMALKQETIVKVLKIFNNYNHSIDIETVKNKEAKMFLYFQLGKLPQNPTEMVRFLVYLATGKTLLIKDKKTIATIKMTNIVIGEFINNFGYERLAEVFFRFKPIFLAFKNQAISNIVTGKKYNYNNAPINKLRRLANKYHKPMSSSYWSTILSKNETVDINVLKEKVKELNNFKKISILQSILVRLENVGIRAFIIRNGKLWVEDSEKFITNNNLFTIYDILYQDLVSSLKEKACNVKLPNSAELKVPSSEKSFIGNYPFGSSFDFSDSDNIVGIHWRGEDGVDDLDLSLMNIDGAKYGWNSQYKNNSNSVVYSGDMTDANPEAVELLYVKGNFDLSAMVKVNRYNGNENCHYRLFLAKEKIDNMKRNYMVNPNNILFTIDCEMASTEMMPGVIVNNKFILCNLRSGNGRVSINDTTNKYIDYTLKNLNSYISLKTLLTDAGFTITDDNPDIDFTNLSKDTFIKLLS